MLNKKQVTAIILDILICVFTALCLLLLYLNFGNGMFHRMLTVVFSIPVTVLLVYELICWSKKKPQPPKREPAVSTLILLGEKDVPIRVWDLSGKTGLLIGKSSGEYLVDVDLSETAFHTYIDPEHALLNYTGSGWWLEDTSSQNGVSVIRKGQELLLARGAPARIEPGDVICIAKYTRIAVN